MSKEILPSNEKQAFLRAYVDQHATSRLHNWPVDKGDGSTSTALLHLSETGQLGDVLRDAEPDLLAACENASRFDPNFNKLSDGTVDIVLARCVQNKQIGVLQPDTLGKPLFRPWR